jgi:6-phosphogluconate dehydrogenase
MHIGIVGLGRMGANMGERLLRGGHQVTGFDVNPVARAGLESRGATSTDSLTTLVQQLEAPRVVWMMVPSGIITESTLEALLALLSPGDTLIDGGNSNYQDSIRRAQVCAGRGIGFVDCGTSGGVWGISAGYSLMIGGDEKIVAALIPIFETLAPAKDRGWGRVGPAGAGHFAKMIHNGIEYGMMQALAEGFSILEHKKDFSFDLHQVGEIWRTGSVIRSWLLDLTTSALGKNPKLAGIAPFVSDSGEGRWTVSEAIELNVPAPVITLALLQRLRSRDTESFADRLLASMRNEFGGHEIKTQPE